MRRFFYCFSGISKIIRTFPLARINKNKHARIDSKYVVWPNYNLACSIDDSVMGLTHVVRGKDLEIGEDRQKMIHHALGLKSPKYFHYGRMKFEDMDLSKSELTKKIESGEYESWEDPRVPSILAYRNRGYKAEAFRKFILKLGITNRDSRITSQEYHKGLDFFNKEILDKESNRFFFIHNPKKVHVLGLENYPTKEIELPKHPENKSFGTRHFPLQAYYLIDSLDFDNLNVGDKIRLMHFGNFEIVSKDEEMEIKFVSKEYSKDFAFKRNIHFLPENHTQDALIVLQNNSRLKGLIEDVGNLQNGECIQFERFGFACFRGEEDSRKKFYFTHK